MNELTLTKTGDELYADSRDVAKMIERPHSDLLKSINTYCKYLIEGEDSRTEGENSLTEGKIPLSDFFVESEYKDSTGRKMPCYRITQKGCAMIANKLTGKKGVLFTARYVTAFENMRKKLETPPQPPQPSSVVPEGCIAVKDCVTALNMLQRLCETQKNVISGSKPGSVNYNEAVKDLRALYRSIGCLGLALTCLK